MVARIVKLASGTFFCLLASCQTAPIPVQKGPAARAATLVLINLSDYAWQVRASSAALGKPSTWSLQARETSERELPAGNYVIEQTVLLKPNIFGATRRFAFSPEAGQTYRWQLGTLLSELSDSESDKK